MSHAPSKGHFEAQAEGHSKGHSEGHSERHSEGHSKGESEGHFKGQSEGAQSEGHSKGQSEGHSWGYGDENGPSTWAACWPEAAGCQQSPVNIEKCKVRYQGRLNDPPLRTMYQPQPLNLKNNGHTVKFVCPQESTLTGGPLGDKVYRLEQFHLHWGAQDDWGSEHAIDGRHSSAEIHLVHRNTEYGSLQEAMTHKEGLAVLSVLVNVGRTAHGGFDVISRYLENVRCKNDEYNVDITFDPTCLLPRNTAKFWTYPGSLTTPPCHETVQFIIFEESLEFSPEQMASLRSLHVGDENSATLKDNFRPVCPLHDRTVLATFRNDN